MSLSLSETEPRTLDEAAAALADGTATARALVERGLDRIADPAGQGARTFLRVDAEAARASADAMDALRRVNRHPGPYAGIPISLKDLFDLAGQPTAAGSRRLAGAAPAARHAPVVARLLAAGLIPLGRTNMTEFAFSGLGINPHHGTPLSPWDRANAHIPGGSSSGAAVSVADGMAFMGLGTDTGGSCRIPAAFCGVTGYKPTARRVPIDGVLSLSPSLDSVGPLARTVACCATIDAILAGAEPAPLPAVALRGLRLAVPANTVMDGMDASTTTAFSRALNRLDNLGVRITHLSFPQFEQVAAANAGGGLPAAEAHAWHRDLMAEDADSYDPRVRARIARGAALTAADLIRIRAERARLVASMDDATRFYDAVAMPTVPIAPPTIASLEADADFNRVNALVLRNPSLANVLDRCAISIPCHRAGEPPAGLMLMGETGGDAHLLALAAAIQTILKD